MAEQQTQTRDNHARFHPPFHFFFAPVTLVLLVIAVYELFRAPGLVSAAQVLLVLVLAVVGFMARTNALKVQDRVIRLEERLRLFSLLPGHLHPALYQLSERQLIALRFASDAELPALSERALHEHLEPKAIKASIQHWRPDHWRV